MNQKEIAEAARTLDHLSMTAMWEENKRLRAALESIVRRWDDSEKTGSLAWLMCEDARAAAHADRRNARGQAVIGWYVHLPKIRDTSGMTTWHFVGTTAKKAWSKAAEAVQGRERRRIEIAHPRPGSGYA